ncbi:hypothetical protein H2198_006984 [Neophaeococcomyces mojaviensis]|uniref:Uncharacterized protein n=1 Tax=Neophaeococcomyces mojaviensis TaxID=3383035 RepID=A0ACC3A1P4_9EURO|nr:hypothetical protein H2198_006984 [Knufia sp. JES_112]
MSFSTRLNCNTLDVFTTNLFEGNQLGLVHIPHGQPLTQAQKQAIAVEYNYSETVFLHDRSPNAASATYDAQIFTPKSELPFAGHPTIGTAVWIFENLETNNDEITINLKAGAVTARFDRASGIAIAEIPQALNIHKDTIPWERVAAVQPSLFKASAEVKRSATPISSIVKGMNFALINLTAQPDLLSTIVVTKDTIPRASDLDPDSDPNLLGNVFYFIRPDTGDDITRIQQRMMAIELEDPATGSASAALTGYLALQKGQAGIHKFEIDQGVEMGRASKIFVDITVGKYGKEIDKIELKGQAIEVMKGTLRIM